MNPNVGDAVPRESRQGAPGIPARGPESRDEHALSRTLNPAAI